MAQFTPNKPVVVTDPQVSVDVSANNPLPVGRHRFSLVVVDDSGNESQPAIIDIIVRDTDLPTAVIDLVNADGAIVSPAVVSAGAKFVLSGKRSTDTAPGKIKEYRFTLLDPVA